MVSSRSLLFKKAGGYLKHNLEWDEEKRKEILFILRVATEIEWMLMKSEKTINEKEQMDIIELSHRLGMELGNPTYYERLIISEIIKS